MFSQLSAWLTGTLWTIEPGKLEAIHAGLSLLMRLNAEERGSYLADLRASQVAVDEMAAAHGAPLSGAGVAVVPLWGTLLDRVGPTDAMSGATSMRDFRRVLSTLAGDPAIGTIILDVDSPGGTVAGTLETGDLVRRVAAEKPVIAVAQTLAASGAFWIASQASEFIVSPSGRVGSVGVVQLHTDESGALEKEGIAVEILTTAPLKTEISPLGPIDDGARAELMRNMQIVQGQFEAALARGRHVPVATVRDQFGQGRVFQAREVVDRGMADGIGTLDDTIARFVGGRPRSRRNGAAATSDQIIEEIAADLKG